MDKEAMNLKESRENLWENLEGGEKGGKNVIRL